RALAARKHPALVEPCRLLLQQPAPMLPQDLGELRRKRELLRCPFPFGHGSDDAQLRLPLDPNDAFVLVDVLPFESGGMTEAQAREGQRCRQRVAARILRSHRAWPTRCASTSSRWRDGVSARQRIQNRSLTLR